MTIKERFNLEKKLLTAISIIESINTKLPEVSLPEADGTLPFSKDNSFDFENDFLPLKNRNNIFYNDMNNDKSRQYVEKEHFGDSLIIECENDFNEINNKDYVEKTVGFEDETIINAVEKYLSQRISSSAGGLYYV